MTYYFDAAGRRTPHDVHKSVRFAFWLAWACLYLLLPTRLFNGETLTMVWRLQQSPWWENFHPNAFAWAPMLQFGLTLARLFGFDQTPGQELFFCQTANGLLTLLLLACVYRWSRLMGSRTSVAFTITGFVGANFTLWHCGTDVNPYILMTLFGTAAVWCAWSYATVGHKDRLYWSGFFLSLALLIHLLAIVLIIPIWYAIWTRQEHPVKRKLLAWGVHAAILALLVGTPYLVVGEGLYKERTGGIVPFLAQGLVRSAPFGAQARGDEQQPWLYSMALGHFNLAFWADHDSLYYTYRRPPTETALFDHPVPGKWLPYLWLLNTILAAIALFPTVTMLRQGEPGRNLAMFFLWTTPSFFIIGAINPVFGYLRLIYLPAMALLVGLWITLSPQTRKRPIQALVVLMLAWNLGMGIWPNSVFGRPGAYHEVLSWRWAMGPNDLLILPVEEDYLSRMVRVFTGADRMLVGGEPRLVYPPPGVPEQDFMLLSGTHLMKLFKRVYLDQDLAVQMDRAGELRFPVLRPPGEVPVEMILISTTWNHTPKLTGKSWPVILHELEPRAADPDPYRYGQQ